jgi:hypothetical protein
MCMPIFGLGTSTHVCLCSIIDHFIIKQHGSHAWYLVEAEVLYDGFTVSHGGTAALLIIARSVDVSILLIVISLA